MPTNLVDQGNALLELGVAAQRLPYCKRIGCCGLESNDAVAERGGVDREIPDIGWRWHMEDCLEQMPPRE